MAYNLYTDLKTPRDITQFTLFRGTTDFSQLQQFDLYEQGYPYLVVVGVPKFLREMAGQDTEVEKLLNSYIHILEYEFTGLDSGIENITSETQEINNGMQSINVITKVTQPSATNFTMTYKEKSGSILTKMHELYLRSVRDPASGFKTYNGIIGEGGIIEPEDAGFDKECFSFLYMHTDNTGLLLEQAVYWVGCMPTTAHLEIYGGKRGEISFQDVGAEFSGFPIRGAAINKRAKEILDFMNSEAQNKDKYVRRNSWNYEYADLANTDNGLAQAKLTK